MHCAGAAALRSGRGSKRRDVRHGTRHGRAGCGGRRPGRRTQHAGRAAPAPRATLAYILADARRVGFAHHARLDASRGLSRRADPVAAAGARADRSAGQLRLRRRGAAAGRTAGACDCGRGNPDPDRRPGALARMQRRLHSWRRDGATGAAGARCRCSQARPLGRADCDRPRPGAAAAGAGGGLRHAIRCPHPAGVRPPGRSADAARLLSARGGAHRRRGRAAPAGATGHGIGRARPDRRAAGGGGFSRAARCAGRRRRGTLGRGDRCSAGDRRRGCPRRASRTCGRRRIRSP